MVSALVSRLVILSAGTLYPAYRSYKAVRTKDVREYVKWMMYWIVYAVFLCCETLADIFVSFWCPFYYELKMIFVLWLLTPYTKGASVLYRKFIHPTLARHERDIDVFLDQAKHESYNTVMRLGSRSILSAREMLAQAAVGGQAYFVQQLKRSQSLDDIATDRAVARRHRVRIEEIQEEDEDFSDGGADGAREWQGYYTEDGNIVEEEFQYLDEEQEERPEPEPQQRPVVRRSRRRKPTGDEQVPDGYATMPRSSQRNTRRRKVNSEIY